MLLVKLQKRIRGGIQTRPCANRAISERGSSDPLGLRERDSGALRQPAGQRTRAAIRDRGPCEGPGRIRSPPSSRIRNGQDRRVHPIHVGRRRPPAQHERSLQNAAGVRRQQSETSDIPILHLWAGKSELPTLQSGGRGRRYLLQKLAAQRIGPAGSADDSSGATEEDFLSWK
jgi:hypothetical protein